MKKTFTLIIVALMLGSFTSFGQVIITQIYEGASFNKVLEITNVGSTPVNMTNPQLYIKLFSNKADIGSNTPTGTYTLTGTLNPGQSFLLIHGKAVLPVYALTYMPSDTASGTANFNGTGTGTPIANTDIVALYSGTTVVDVFAWGTFQYANQSYYRNAIITAPNATWTLGEWTSVTNAVVDAAAANTIERLGYHPGGGPANPSILITAPANGSTVTTANVNVTYSVANFAIPTNGHIHYSVDGGASVEDSSANPIALTGLASGTHKVVITLVNKNHVALVPVAKDSVSFTVNLAPSVDITSPANGSTVYTPNVNVAFTVSNFTIPTNGHIHYNVDGGSYMMHYVTTPISLTGLTHGSHKVILMLVDTGHIALNPMVKDSVTFNVDLTPVVITPIWNIQSTSLPNGDSPFKDSIVTTTGVVTASFSQGYFIQGCPHQYCGLYVYDATHSPALGDSIVLKGLVSEYYNYTELKNITSYNTIATGQPIHVPLAVSTHSVKNEGYEGCLVSLTNAKCTYVNTSGWWKVQQDTAILEIGKLMYPFPTAIVNEYYNVTGCVNYSFGAFKIEPRKATDIEVYVGVAENTQDNFRLYPNPATSVLNVTDIEDVDQVKIINLLGETVNVYNVSGNSASINVSDLNNGLYFISLMKDNTVMATRKFFKQ